MSMTLTRREARLALIQALEKKYPEEGILVFRGIEIEVIEAKQPEDIAVEARKVTG